MADYILNDTMHNLVYVLDDRYIYNDIRSELGYSTTNTIVDEVDPATYEWRMWHRWTGLPQPGYTYFDYFTATAGTPLQWRLRDVSVYDWDYQPYHDYTIKLITTSDPLTRAVEIKNTGTKNGTIGFTVEYQVLIAEAIEHTYEEVKWHTLQVRATNDESIRKYGRRTMNLVWPTGASETQMQAVVDRHLEKYREPAARLVCTLKGDTSARKAIIYGAEVSQDVQVVSANLGLNDVYFIDSIDIHEGLDGIPVGTLGLTDKYTTETLALFILDSSLLDGDHVLA